MDKILLVDDVKPHRETKKGLLASSLVHILTASDGHEALAVAHKELPNLIVIDNHLPGMDCAGCCRAIKTDPHLMHIPVVILSNAVKPADFDGCGATAADDWIPKPVDDKLFLSTLKKYLPAIDCRVIRAPLRTEVRLTVNDGFHVGMSKDISLNGIYVTSELQPLPGDELRFSFVLPGSEVPTEVRGKVAWLSDFVRNGKAGSYPGFGVEFLEITGKGAPDIRRSELEYFVSLRAGTVAADPVWS
jgi:two-component system, OmpR family, alkaline phosphatase synthesis response regulator PhoP